MDDRVLDDAPPLVGLGLGRLKLRLDERHEVTALPYPLPGDRQDESERDERQVHDHDAVGLVGKLYVVDLPRVELLQILDARIIAQLGVKLSRADVDARHAHDATLQQAVGEAAGRRAHVESMQAFDGNLEMVERAFDFFAAAGNEARGLINGEDRVFRERLRRLIDDGIGPRADLTGEDERLGDRAGRRERKLQQQFVRTHPAGLRGHRSVEETREGRGRFGLVGTDAQTGFAGGAAGFHREAESAGHRNRIA